MIIKNIIKFGYGDVAVGYGIQEITFQQFKPPSECGTRLHSEDVEFVSEKIILDISYDDYIELRKYLKIVSNRIANEFTFKEYIFDFTNYNEESVNVCKKKLESAMYWYFLCCAA